MSAPRADKGSAFALAATMLGIAAWHESMAATLMDAAERANMPHNAPMRRDAAQHVAWAAALRDVPGALAGRSSA